MIPVSQPESTRRARLGTLNPLALVPSLPLILAQSAADAVLIPDGTEVVHRLSEPLSSNRAYAGDLVRFTLDEDVVVEGVMIARTGDRAPGRSWK